MGLAIRCSWPVRRFDISGALPVFWNLPTAFLSASAAAGGIAAINAIGNISGYAAPQIVGRLRDASGNYKIPMLVMGALVLVAGVLVPLAARAAETRRAIADKSGDGRARITG